MGLFLHLPKETAKQSEDGAHGNSGLNRKKNGIDRFMKQFIAMVLVLGSAAQAQADGFRCETSDGDLRITMYNHTSPNSGTRNSSTMVLSDPAVQSGRKTIAKFSSVKGNVSNSGASYEAVVDLRVRETKRAGERLLGTRLGELDSILVDVDFNYGTPVMAGDILPGRLVAIKRSGKRIVRELDCARYLKN
jgi:hypothetical protein